MRYARRHQASLVHCLPQKQLLLQAGTAKLWECPNRGGCRPVLAEKLCSLVHQLRQELGCEQAVSEKMRGQKVVLWWASPRVTIHH